MSVEKTHARHRHRIELSMILVGSSRNSSIEMQNIRFSESVNGNSSVAKYAKAVVAGAAKSQAKQVAAQKFLETTAGKAVGKALYHTAHDAVSSACKAQLGKTVVAKTASGIVKKSVAGAASRSVVSAAMKGNVVTAGVGMLINSASDVVQFCRGKQSGGQFAKNIAKNAVETGGGLAGSAAGAAIGSAICPGIGTAVGAFIGCLCGGSGARSLV